MSGGLMRCGGCGRRMTSTSITLGNGRTKRYFYYRCTKPVEGSMACPGPKTVSAEKVETKVWQVVSSILKDSKTLRADLDAMVELERAATNSHPESEAKAWAEKLAEADRKRSRYQDMAAEGLITLDELKVKLAALEELRETSRRELDALSRRRKMIVELERDKDALLETYVGMVPEALDSLTPEEHHYVYKMLRLRVALRPDAPPEVSGMFGGDLDVSKTETASGPRSPLPTRRRALSARL